jgi:putative DNA primase/helicase
MEVMEGLRCSSLLTSNITSSALFRSTEKRKPSSLIDEADTFAKHNNELNGLINAGHTRQAMRIIRTEITGDSHEPRVFEVFCPQMLAGIR